MSSQSEHQNTGDNEPKPLGMAGAITKAFIHSPLTPLALITLLVLGIMGLIFTPRQEDPQISVPMVDIFFQFPGASSDQVSSLATDPLERMMSEIPGIKHVYSASQRGSGMVTVQFIVGEEMESSLVKLYDKLASNMDKIPPGVSEPLVKPRGVDDVPVVTLTLLSESVDDAGLRLVALEVMQRLKEVQNTSQSFIVGGRSEEMRVEILPERLRGFGISLDQLASTIKSANIRNNVGNVETGGQNMRVYTGRFLRHAEDLRRLIVGVRNGSPVYVRDVAKVTEGPGEASSIVQYFTGPAASEDMPKTTGAAAVTIAIAKKTGTNGVSVANDILAKIEKLKGQIIPDNIDVAVTRNYGKTANDKVNELIMKMLAATGAVTLLIYFFLGFKPTIVVATVIPVIILITLFSAWVLGYTVDRVSLFALIFSIGILVDDATVVVENIYRRWLMHGSVNTAITIDAVREVGNPTILATFTIIAALLPMGFVSGMMGPYMRPIPVLGSVAMMFSLLAAFIFTPWLAMRVRPSLQRLKDMEKSERKLSQRLDGFFCGLLIPLLENPKKARAFRIGLWVLFMLACSLFYTTHVAVKMLPLDNKPEFNVVVNMPEGTALPVTANLVQELTTKLLNVPEVTAIQTYAGTASPFNFNGLVRHYYLRQRSWEGDIQVQLLDKDDRDRSSHEIAVAVRQFLTPIAKKYGGRIAVVEMPPGPPVLQTMVAEVYGPDAQTRRQVARDLTNIFEKSETVVDVDNYMEASHPTWTFAIDHQKAQHLNVTVADISRQLAMVMGGFKLGDVKIGHELESRHIIMQAPLGVRGQINRLGEVPITTRDGKLIPLGSVGSFKPEPQDPVIYHKDLRAIEYVTGEVSGRLAAPVYGMIEISKLLEDYRTPDGVELSGTLIGPPSEGFKSGFEWTGEWTVTYETFRDMGLAFVAALILIYMLIVLEFGNFRLPGIIMAPIPLTLIGIIPGHWLLGAEFTATSMIGWIALAGIIVRNSILLVDFSKREIMRGMNKHDAVIQACCVRTRPILITQLTMIAGSASILSDPIFQGMAISLLFGAIVSTALTLVVIPLACARVKGAFSTPQAEMDMDEAIAATSSAGAAATGSASTIHTEASGVDRSGLFSMMSNTATRGINLLSKPANFTKESLQNLFGNAGASIPEMLTPVFYALIAGSNLIWRVAREGVNNLFAKSEPQNRRPMSAGAAATNQAASSSPEPMMREQTEAVPANTSRKKPARKTTQDSRAKTISKAKPAVKAKAQTKTTSTSKRKSSTAAKPTASTSSSRKSTRKSPAKADKLTQISGIGPKFEKELKKLGVTKFDQIAKWKRADVAAMETALNASARVDRDDWIGQAKAFAKAARATGTSKTKTKPKTAAKRKAGAARNK